MWRRYWDSTDSSYRSLSLSRSEDPGQDLLEGIRFDPPAPIPTQYVPICLRTSRSRPNGDSCLFLQWYAVYRRRSQRAKIPSRPTEIPVGAPKWKATVYVAGFLCDRRGWCLGWRIYEG